MAKKKKEGVFKEGNKWKVYVEGEASILPFSSEENADQVWRELKGLPKKQTKKPSKKSKREYITWEKAKGRNIDEILEDFPNLSERQRSSYKMHDELGTYDTYKALPQEHQAMKLQRSGWKKFANKITTIYKNATKPEEIKKAGNYISNIIGGIVDNIKEKFLYAKESIKEKRAISYQARNTKRRFAKGKRGRRVVRTPIGFKIKKSHKRHLLENIIEPTYTFTKDKIVKPTYKFVKEAAGDLIDRVDAGYETLEKKLKKIRPHYALLFLIAAIAIFSFSEPSTTSFIIFEQGSDQLNYKVLIGTILFITAVFIAHKKIKRP